jgi:hypothetical protein
MTHRLLLSCILCAGLLSCGRENDVATVRVTESPPPPVTAGAPASGPVGSSADRFGMTAPAATAPAPPQITGTRPQDWQEAPGSSLRLQNFTAGPNGATEVYLTVLPGGGGGVEANVNRWRAQMGQPAFTAEEMEGLERVEVLGQEALIADISGTFQGMSGDLNHEDYRMLGAIFEHQDSAVFVKMTGPAQDVAAERENFMNYVLSLRMSGAGGAMASGDLPPGHPPIGGATSDPTAGDLPPGHPPLDSSAGGMMGGGMPAHPEARQENLEWTLPEGWQRGEDRPVRLANFVVEGSPAIECYVTVLPDNAGGIEANVNLWRQQLGQAALTPEELMDMPQLQVMGQLSPLVEVEGRYADMSGQLHEDYMLLGVIRPMEDRTLFVKMVGPAADMRAQRENFLSFCQSLRLPAEAAGEV